MAHNLSPTAGELRPSQDGTGIVTGSGRVPGSLPAGLASQLVCRVRPGDKASPLISVSAEHARVDVVPEKGHPGEPLRFDRMLNSQEASEQEVLFEHIRPAVQSCLHGSSCTVVAYGGPQSGKSYALSGFFTPLHLHGLAPRTIQYISEVMDADPSALPAIELSFFEIQQDTVCDLLSRGYPKVNLREVSHPPYVILDDTLTSHKCDAVGGYNRLLDTYFTGLEHRRKGTHTCFQITFLHNNGRNPSFLRFIEISWPRPQGAPGPTTTSPTVPGAKVPTQTLSPATVQGKACVALEQVLQCKLAGTAPVPYRASPLSLLLKPCFEGSSSLVFLYCLRLEQSQLPCLALSAPLVAKLHLWLTKTRRRAPAGAVVKAPSPVGMVPQGAQHQPGMRSPAVPPLRLGAGPIAGDTAGAATATIAVPCVQGPTSSHSHGSDEEDSLPEQISYVSNGKQQRGEMAGLSSSEVTGDRCDSTATGGTTTGAVSPAVSMPGTIPTVIPPPGPAQVQAQLQAQMQAQAAAMQAQVGIAAASYTEVQYSNVQDSQKICIDCMTLLEVKQVTAHTLRADASRSAAILHDLDIVLSKLRKDREAAGDGPSEKETNLRMLFEKMSKSLSRTTKEIRKLHDDIEALSQFCSGNGFPVIYDSYLATQEQAEAALAFANTGTAVLSSTPGIEQGRQSDALLVIPQLRLDTLPQEYPDLTGQDLAAGTAPAPMSPSSASSGSDSGINLSSDRRGYRASLASNQNMAPGRQSPGPSRTGHSHSLTPRSFVNKPAKAANSQKGGMMQHWQYIGSSGSVIIPAPVGMVTQIHPQLPGARALQQQQQKQQLVVATDDLLLSGPGPAGTPVYGTPVRKSHSTASLRSLSLGPMRPSTVPVAPSSPAAPAGRTSPVMGHRSDFVSASPMRSTLPGTASAAVAAAGGTTAGAGAASPPQPLKRSLLVPTPGPRPGLPRPVATRDVTPMRTSPMRGGSYAATTVARATGAASPGNGGYL